MDFEKQVDKALGSMVRWVIASIVIAITAATAIVITLIVFAASKI